MSIVACAIFVLQFLSRFGHYSSTLLLISGDALLMHFDEFGSKY